MRCIEAGVSSMCNGSRSVDAWGDVLLQPNHVSRSVSTNGEAFEVVIVGVYVIKEVVWVDPTMQ